MRPQFVLVLFLLTAGAGYAAAQSNSKVPDIKIRRLSPRAAIASVVKSGRVEPYSSKAAAPAGSSIQ